MTSRYRPLAVGGSLSAHFEPQADGSTLISSTEALRRYPVRLTDRLLHWAALKPDHTLVAKRDLAGRPNEHPSGDWRRVSYAQALSQARSIAQALLDHGLSAERPLAVLSDNDIEHFLLGLGAMLAGVPYAPISAAYSTVSQDFGKLRHIFDILTPGMVFADSASAYGRAIAAVVPADVPVVLTDDTRAGVLDAPLTGRPTIPFADLVATPASDDVDAAHAQVGADTIAKFLFTSGSTKLPKAVINTQRMLCSNQQMLLQCFPGFAEVPPVLVDWLPWNHTFGGNHNLGLVLYNGGTLYIDDGKPTPKLFGETLRNLREIAPTAYFNVPKGFDELANALAVDAELRDRFFSRVEMLYFAGAGLSQPVWDKLDAVAEAACGERIRLLAGMGMTETSPFAICANSADLRAGEVGLPAPGMTLKLVPLGNLGSKTEVRYHGPNVTPGYWRAAEQTAESFDAGGFFCSGDALKYVDAVQPQRGLAFDGRIAEDFKLDTGTFVSVGPLRAKVVAAGDPLVQDVVIAGVNRGEIGLLLFPRLDSCRALAEPAGLPADASVHDVLAAPPVAARFQQLLDQLHASGTGSASRPARALLLVDAPSIDRGEVTDKGSINQRLVLQHRAALVEHLYAGGDGVLLPRAGGDGVLLPRAGGDGVLLPRAGGDGVLLPRAGGDGVLLPRAGGDGVLLPRAGGDGVLLPRAGGDGVLLPRAGGDGVLLPRAGGDGVLLPRAGGDGVLLPRAGGDGAVLPRAGGDAAVLSCPGGDGALVSGPDGDAGRSHHPGDDGAASPSRGSDGAAVSTAGGAPACSDRASTPFTPTP